MPGALDRSSSPAICLLAVAPQRFIFFAWATTVVMATLWWTLWLFDAAY
jgi:hypothetical protein